MDENRTQVLFPVKNLPDGLRASAVSVTGTRDYQEDCLMYQVLEDGVLGAVCDGMGGLSHGERSSACAVDSLAAYFKHRERTGVDMGSYWRKAIDELDEKVAELKGNDGRLLGAGTTLTAVFLQGNLMTYAAAGDSMIYLVRRGECRELVRMHNYRLLLKERLEKGILTEEEYQLELKKGEALITYLGMDGVQVCDCSAVPLELEPGDRVLLCSDGLYKCLDRETICWIVESCPVEDFECTALELIRTIFQGPPQSLDNISVLCFLYTG